MSETNFLEQFSAKKQRLVQLVRRACECGWIDDKRRDDILAKIETDTLTIGVIGQMKCGKSTFLNAFVFGDTVLPSATTPMTAALSVITYGSERSVKADFYTQDEWAEQQFQARRDLDAVEGDEMETSKIKAARELVAKASRLDTGLNGLLGQSKTDSLERLEDYVGADGKYVAITKSVRITMPLDYLRGIEIVDTPGFNDPIVSREERTRQFLQRADAVVMMLYAGRPFDVTDRSILFRQVGQAGVGKVLIAINKYDIPLGNGESEDQIQDYVERQLRQAAREQGDERLSNLLLDTRPVTMSAEMALLGQLPMSRIQGDEQLRFAMTRYARDFDYSSQPRLREASHIDRLTDKIKQTVLAEKDKILFAKPINAILASGAKLQSDLSAQIVKTQARLEALEMPDDELEERQRNLERLLRRLNKAIDNLGGDITEQIRAIVRDGKRDMENAVDAACRAMDGTVDNEFGVLTKRSKINTMLSSQYETLYQRTLPRLLGKIAEAAVGKLRKHVKDFLFDVERQFHRYLPDTDINGLMEDAKRKISLDVEDGLFDKDLENEYWHKQMTTTNGAFLGVGRCVTHNAHRDKLHEAIRTIKKDYDPSPVFDNVFSRQDEIISNIRTLLVTELAEPMKQQVDEIIAKASQREQMAAEARRELEATQSLKKKVEAQTDEITTLAQAI